MISLSLMPFSFEAFSVRFSSSSRLNWRIALLVFQCKSDSYLIIWCAWVCWFSEIAVEQLPHCRALYQAERGRNNKRYIPVKLLDLLESLISVRYSRIKWENGWSEIFSIHFGVRQGSVLSPFLFAVYLDDLSKWCDSDSSSYIILYADDILLIAPSLSKLECDYMLVNVNSHDWTWQLTVKNRVAYELDPDAMLFVVTLLALAVKLSYG